MYRFIHEYLRDPSARDIVIRHDGRSTDLDHTVRVVIYELRILLDEQRDIRVLKDILICGVERAGEVYIPSGAFTLKADDILYFAATREEARKFLKNIGIFTKQVRNAMIVGGGLSAYYLANELLHTGIDVHILEASLDRCNELSTLLPDAVIINSDATTQEGLLAAGLKDMEAFVPLTGIDEENIDHYLLRDPRRQLRTFEVHGYLFFPRSI